MYVYVCVCVIIGTFGVKITIVKSKSVDSRFEELVIFIGCFILLSKSNRAKNSKCLPSSYNYL